MEKIISINISLDEFENIQKTWISDVLRSVNNPDSKKEEQLLNRQETSELLGVSLPTLNEYSKRGIIPAYRVGSRVRYKKTEIFESLKSFRKYKRRDDS